MNLLSLPALGKPERRALPKGLRPPYRDVLTNPCPLAQCAKLRQRTHGRRLSGQREAADAARRAKKQLIHRLPPDFVRRILKDLNSNALDAPSASARLGVSRARLYHLRTDYFRDKPVRRQLELPPDEIDLVACGEEYPMETTRREF